jgi:acetyl esterase/lipase
MFAIDPETAAAMPPAGPKAARGDWKTLRENGNIGQAYFAGLTPPSPDVRTTSYTEGPLELRWYTKNDEAPGSAVVFAHGGGMVLADLDLYDSLVSMYVSLTGVPFLAVGYRLAPESRGTALAEDVFTGLKWLLDNAPELKVDPARVAIMGDSAGGGIAAGTAILARDRGVALARQILVYPMLDDRNLVPDKHLEPVVTWTYDSNFTGWSALLGDDLGSDRVSPVAAPARLTDFEGLAPAYIDVGELDIFRDEDIAYAQALSRAGVSVELHVLPGAIHGFDRFAPASRLTRRAVAARAGVIRDL